MASREAAVIQTNSTSPPDHGIATSNADARRSAIGRCRLPRGAIVLRGPAGRPAPDRSFAPNA